MADAREAGEVQKGNATVSIAETSPKAEAVVAADQSERAMMRAATVGLPVTTVVAALGVGMASSPGPAILVLAAGMLLGVIMLFWSSLRTLSGDAPLPADLVEAMATRRALVDDLADKKRMTLLALKDLERDHAVGKIDDSDYAALAASYRAQAKEILRDLDHAIDKERARAEEIARAHLKKKGLSGAYRGASASVAPAAPAESEGSAPGDDGAAPLEAKAASTRQTCPECAASNEPDATFCKACGTAIKSKESLDAAG